MTAMRATAPITMRAAVTCSGLKASRAILIQRKLEPQTTASVAMSSGPLADVRTSGLDVLACHSGVTSLSKEGTERVAGVWPILVDEAQARWGRIGWRA